MKVLVLWTVTCLLVFHMIDMYATRPVPIHVEDYRGANLDDEQVLSLAVQAAYRQEENSWWIHAKRPYLVFDVRHTYEIDPSLYAAFELKITTDDRQNIIGILAPTISVLQAP